MVTFPNCKINIGLNVVEKREDGYHNIETIFFPIPIHDALEIISSSDNKPLLYNTGIATGEYENNLCLKAYRLVRNDFPQVPEIKIHLHKMIPMGAGLGGGSADATFTLLLLNKKYQLNIPEKQLFGYALQLGSDCPFFLLNNPSFASGRGEVLKTLDLSLSDYKILILNPGIHINTREIFQKIVPAFPQKNIQQIIQQPVETWKDELKNDFEKIVFPQHQQIKKVKEMMYQNGALYASMTGTGSTVFGIFNKNTEINFSIEKSYFHHWIDEL